MKILENSAKFLLFTSLFLTSTTYAAIDSFKVTIDPSSAQVWEALDITIEALDKSNETVTDYVWTIIVFSESDKEAEFPNELEENTYEFKTSDQGKVKFENAVKFKNAWKQSIHVYDLNDDSIMWMAEVDISASEAPAAVDISIISPESWLTLGTNKVTVSGTTKKNHRVVISVNGKDDLNTTSNSEGMFEAVIENLQDGENTFKASVLDADNKVVWESNVVSIKINASKPKLQSIKVTPVDEVPAESEVNIEVISDKGLDSVSVIINDVLTKLQEGREWVYMGKTSAPKDEGMYAVDVILKNELGLESKELNVASLKVIPALSSPSDETPTDTATGEVEMKAPDNLDPLKITGLKLTELKTKSVLTWDKIEKATGYNVYKRLEDGKLQLIETVSDPSFTVNITGEEITHDYFYVRAIAKTGSGDTYEGDLSEATKIQTGPEMYILLALIAIILGTMFYMFKRKIIA